VDVNGNNLFEICLYDIYKVLDCIRNVVVVYVLSSVGDGRCDKCDKCVEQFRSVISDVDFNGLLKLF